MRGAQLALIPDGEGAIEAFMDFHPHLRVAAVVGTGQNLQASRAHRDRVIVGHAAVVLETKDRLRIEPRGPGPVGGLRLRRRLGEAGVVASEEFGQEGIGSLAVGNPREAQFSDETVLEGAEAVFDAALGRYEIVRCILPFRWQHVQR